MSITEKDLIYEHLGFSTKNLFQFKERMNWKGKGTVDDPLRIDNIEGFPPILDFKKIDCYVLIENIICYRLTCSRVKNFTIRNCMFHSLILSYGSNILLANNKIIEFKSRLTRSSVYENNEFSWDSLNNLESRFHDKRVYSMKNLTKIFILIFLFAIVYLWLMGLVYNEKLWTISIVLLFFLFAVGYAHFRLRKRIISSYNIPLNILNINKVMKNTDELINIILKQYKTYKAKWILRAFPYLLGVLFFIIIIISGIMLSNYILF